MKIKHYAVIPLVLASTLFIYSTSSCSSKQRTSLVYFQDLESKLDSVVPVGDYMAKIQPGDELYISVTSTSPEASAHYNLPLQNPATNNDLLQSTTPRQQSYTVTTTGDIMFPILGRLHVAGMTTEQLAALITERVSADVEDPMVLVRMVNFTVKVAGEVNSPRVVTVTDDRFSVLDALTAAGDLTEYGERSNVLLVREENGQRTFHRLNLNDPEVLKSPYFFVRQNDYIYVEPNKIRQDNSKYNQNNAYKLTVMSTIVGTASVIASLVIALTVK